MRNIILILCFLLVMSVTARADLFEFKLLGGIELFKDDFKMERVAQTLKLFGGLGVCKGDKKSRFEGDILLSTDFRKLDTNGGEYYYRLYKFSLPLLYKYKFAEFNSFYLVGGGSASFILLDRTDMYGKPWKDHKIKTFIDYGLVLGSGYEYDLSRTSFTIEARYYLGLNELEFGGYSFKRNGFFILLGVLFW